MENKVINVFVINGFLESGKTRFIKETIQEDGFYKQGNTLVIALEEGEEEYDPFLLTNYYTSVVYITDPNEFTPRRVDELIKEYKPDRIIIEFNGMWDITEVDLPDYLNVGQIITLADANTFDLYLNNMRQKSVTMFQNTDVVIINRATEDMNLLSMKRNIKLANPNVEVAFEGENGPINSSFEEDLPYDVHKDIIDIKDEDFGIWFLDAMEQRDRYNKKVVKFTAQVYIPNNAPPDCFVPGRTAMTCCSDDMTVLGYPAINESGVHFKPKSWYSFTALMEYRDDIEGGPLLHIKSFNQVSPIKEPITKF